MENLDNKLIIKGVTNSGKKFRPSDWAQRLTTAVSSFGPGRRIIYQPKVEMATFDGINCVVVDPTLEEDNPIIFEFLMKFGTDNDLQIMDSKETNDQSVTSEI